jgi:hypothetical protein
MGIRSRVSRFVADTGKATASVVGRVLHSRITTKIALAFVMAWGFCAVQASAFEFTDVVTITGTDIDFGVTAIVASVVALIVAIFAGLGVLKMTSAALTWGLNKFSRGTKSA